MNVWKSNGGKILNLNEENIYKYKVLVLHHLDPFDRMLIAQALTENLSIISSDTKFDLYQEINRMW